MEKMGNKRILLFGYSRANLGDDLFVYTLVTRYKDIQFFIQITDENYKKAFENLENLKCLDEKRYVNNINIDDYDGFIYVGGSIFKESEYARHEAKEFNEFIKKVKKNNKKFFYMSCNFGPNQTNEYLEQVKENFKLCDEICFRDKYSYSLFKDIPSVKYGSDLTYLYDYSNIEQTKTKKSIGITVIDLKNRENLSEKKEIYDDYIKRIVIKFAKRGYKVSLISFCEFEKDETAIERIMKLIPKEYLENVNTLLYKGNLEEFLKEYSKFELMVCTRFHALILSTVFRQKIYNLLYSNKSKKFIEDYNLFRKVDEIEKLQYDTYLRKYHFKKVSKHKMNLLKNKSYGQVENLEKWLNA